MRGLDVESDAVQIGIMLWLAPEPFFKETNMNPDEEDPETFEDDEEEDEDDDPDTFEDDEEDDDEEDDDEEDDDEEDDE